MNNALILNSGSSWAAYQMGALKKLVEEDNLHFDLCAGTGIGAMNAAFIACGEWEALNLFWKDIRGNRPMLINWKTPFKRGFIVGKPRQKFINKYVSEEKLKAKGTVLVISCLNLTSGMEEIFTYPGENRLSLPEAVIAALAIPGMSMKPNLENDILIEGTYVRSFILHRIFQLFAPKQMYAVATYAQGTNKVTNPRRYTTWMHQIKRAFQLNLGRDVDHEINKTERDIKAMQEYKRNMEQMDGLIHSHVKEEELETSLIKVVNQHRKESQFTNKTLDIPTLIKIVSRKEIEFPMWSFKKNNLNSLQEAGYSDACEVLASYQN